MAKMDNYRFPRGIMQKRIALRKALGLALVCMVSACGGGGSSPATVSEAADLSAPSSATSTDISGKATFQMVPHSSSNNSLLYQQTYSTPIRGAVVELVSDSGALLDTAVTSENGDYLLSTQVDQHVSIRVKAQMQRSGSPSWDVSVVDNVNRDALYALTSGSFSTTGASMVRNLEAGSGWTGNAYTETRAAAPFAILDTVYDSLKTVLEAAPQTNFPKLALNWSVNNRPTVGSMENGEIGSSLFRVIGGASKIYVLGAADADTDEYDSHVVAHEFTHYLHSSFGRSDSLGGSHFVGDRLDPRVAFSEGIASAFAAIFLNDSNYVDSLGFGQASGFNINIENNNLRNRGWFNEGSVQAIIYDLFDTEVDGADKLALGFGPVYEALTGRLRTDAAFVTIHAYLDALKRGHPAIADMIDDIATMQGVRTVGSDAYAKGENNSAGRFDKVLPIYTELPLDGSVIRLCSIAGNEAFGTRNKLGNRRFMRLNVTHALPNQFTVITAQGPAGSDPELILYRAGVVQSSLSAVDGQERLRRIFTEGEYVLETYEYTNTTDEPLGTVCFDVSASIE